MCTVRSVMLPKIAIEKNLPTFRGFGGLLPLSLKKRAFCSWGRISTLILGGKRNLDLLGVCQDRRPPDGSEYSGLLVVLSAFLIVWEKQLQTVRLTCKEQC